MPLSGRDGSAWPPGHGATPLTPPGSASQEPKPARARAAATCPQPGRGGTASYNRAQPTRRLAGCDSMCARPAKPRSPATMAHATAPASDRPHVAEKRYIYAWGAGTAEGNGNMKDLLGGKGAGLAEMTLAGLPTPPGFTITTEACNDYFANGKSLPAGLWDDVLEAVKEVEAPVGQGLRRPGQPAARLGPLGCQVLDARDDGHRPQPRPQRGDARGPDRPVGQRALRLGRVPPVHRHVRPDRHGREGGPVRRAPREAQGRARPRRQGHRPRRRRPQGPRGRVQGGREGRHRPRLPDRPLRAAGPGHRRPCSPPGSASAPTTTATARRSPTTWAPPSTS